MEVEASHERSEKLSGQTLLFSWHKSKEVKDVIVPNVVGKETEKAIKELEKLGFKYTIESKENDTVAEGLVIRTNPKAGSTRKKGDTITIIESLGSEYHYLEDYTGKNYTEIKAKLELIGVNVNIEKKDLDQEIKERRGEVQLQERRLVQKEENLENRISRIREKGTRINKKRFRIRKQSSRVR